MTYYMFKKLLELAQSLQEFNDDVQSGLSYRNAVQIRKVLQLMKVEAQRLRLTVNEARK